SFSGCRFECVVGFEPFAPVRSDGAGLALARGQPAFSCDGQLASVHAKPRAIVSVTADRGVQRLSRGNGPRIAQMRDADFVRRAFSANHFSGRVRYAE